MSLINPKKLFKAAESSSTALCAFNVVNYEGMRAALKTAQACNTPVIIATSEGALKYFGARNFAAVAKNLSKEFKVDFALHLDHGTSFAACKECIDANYTSVMIDASHLPFEENVALTRQVAIYAKRRGVFVEAELGRLPGKEDNIESAQALFTDPSQAADFIKRTRINSLAISVGTSHGAYKTATPGGLKIDLIKKIHAQNPGTFLVLHGASTINKETVTQINALGGKISKTSGNDPTQIKTAIKNGIRKVNVDSDLRLAYTLGVRRLLSESLAEFDIRKINSAGYAEVEKACAEKIELISK